MMFSPADISRWALIALGLGSDPDEVAAWPIFATGEPTSPDDCITVYDTAGNDDGRAMTSGELFSHYGIQIRVRAVDHETGWVKADSLRTVMSQQVNALLLAVGSSNYLVHAFTKIGVVLPIGKDAPKSKRSLFTINLTAAIRRL